eukprot:GHVU01034950.1.p6 GENE.GHVU01034950.1~~GHVU01034950.1.p6  ORF type:complete len:113 (-),score=11.64 GHVU01034950.1:3192-3530(-)
MTVTKPRERAAALQRRTERKLQTYKRKTTGPASSPLPTHTHVRAADAETAAWVTHTLAHGLPAPVLTALSSSKVAFTGRRLLGTDWKEDVIFSLRDQTNKGRPCSDVWHTNH